MEKIPTFEEINDALEELKKQGFPGNSSDLNEQALQIASRKIELNQSSDDFRYED